MPKEKPKNKSKGLYETFKAALQQMNSFDLWEFTLKSKQLQKDIAAYDRQLEKRINDRNAKLKAIFDRVEELKAFERMGMVNTAAMHEAFLREVEDYEMAFLKQPNADRR